MNRDGLPAMEATSHYPSHETSNGQLTELAIAGEKRKREESGNEFTPQDTNHEPPNRQSTDDTVKRKKEGDPPTDSESPKDPSLHSLWKTSLCSYFRRHKASCSHGDACRYAHGEAELRQRPDGTWDPTSERAKKAANAENGDNSEVGNGKEKEIMMTEMALNDGDDDGENGDVGLSKCLVHLPRKWHADQLRKFLLDQGISFKSAKKKKGMTVGFVTFESLEHLNRAVQELQGKSVGNKALKVADVIPRSFEKKVKSAMALPQNTQQSLEAKSPAENSELLDSSDGTMPGNVDGDGSVSRTRTVREVVTPLAHMPYSEQLEHKKSNLMQILKKLTRNARKACPNGVSLPEWILKSREIGGLPCKLEGIVASPLVDGYRNKCEFSVGYSLDGKPTVGFMLGNFREGITAVEEPTDCPNLSRIACKYAMIFQEFLQHSSLPIWNRFKNTGFWRQLTVREGRTPGRAGDAGSSNANVGEVLLMVQICSVGHDDKLVTGEFERLAQAFSVGALENSPPLPLTALVVQDHQGISNAAPADAPLRSLPIPKAENGSELQASRSGEEARIHDHISNLRFCISPTAFFQVNTLAAEKLYSLAGDWAGLGPDTLLFDICCGTGTIGLTLAHHVGMVVGIEMNASAVSDAYRNAEINGITNCKFVCGKAEDVIGSLLKEYLKEPEKQDEIPSQSENGDKENTDAEKNSSSSDKVPDSEVSPTNLAEDGAGESGSPGSGGQEVKNDIKKSCTLKDAEASAVPHFKNVVAIVDPPRVGLHPIVIKALRTHQNIRRLVYVSCNIETLVANAIELCTPSRVDAEKGNKNNRGWRNMSSAGLARHRLKSMPSSEPFHPVKAMAVDLFPHTPHCEMVLLMER